MYIVHNYYTQSILESVQVVVKTAQCFYKKPSEANKIAHHKSSKKLYQHIFGFFDPPPRTSLKCILPDKTQYISIYYYYPSSLYKIRIRILYTNYNWSYLPNHQTQSSRYELCPNIAVCISVSDQSLKFTHFLNSHFHYVQCPLILQSII